MTNTDREVIGRYVENINRTSSLLLNNDECNDPSMTAQQLQRHAEGLARYVAVML